MKLYKALIRPVVVYGSECWVLTENIKQNILVFEDIDKDIWPNTEGKRRVETQNNLRT